MSDDFPAFALSEEHQALREAVRALADDKIAPRAADVDRTSEFPWDVYEALVKADFHAVHIPSGYGGAGADAIATAIVIEEVARACASSSLIPAVNKLGTVPPAFAAVATRGSQAGTGLLPARNWMSAPELTRDSWTDATVTGWPMSSRSPVPCFSAPNRAVAYHWLIQGRARSPPMACAARCGSSPSAVPAGPKAATLAGAST